MSDTMRKVREPLLAVLLLCLVSVPAAPVTAAPASGAPEAPVPVWDAPELPEAGLQQPQQPGTQRPEDRQAQEPEQLSQPIELHPEAEEAISRLRSPWCPGLMLEVCPSREAAAFRDTLQTMAQQQGIGSDSLVEWTLARYGEEWRAVPQTEGAGLLAWVIPPLALVLGMGVVFLVLRRLRSGSGAPEGERRSISDEDRERLAEAMEEMEKEGR